MTAPLASDEYKVDEFIELLDDCYVVKARSTEVYRGIYKSRKATSGLHKRTSKASSLVTRKAVPVKRLKKKKGRGDALFAANLTCVQNAPQQRRTSKVPTSFPRLIESVDLTIEDDSTVQPTSASDESGIPSPRSKDVGSNDTSHSHIAESVGPTSLLLLDEGLGGQSAGVPEVEEEEMMDIVKNICWEITSAYHYQQLLTEEVVGESPLVELEPEPTNLADPNAIKLLFQAKDKEWLHGGYVSRNQTQRVRELERSIINVRVAYWRKRGNCRIPYVQLLYRDRIKRVAATKKTFLTPSIVTEKYWIHISSRKLSRHQHRLFGKWLVFEDVGQKLDSLWHRVAYAVENGLFGRGCTHAKCSTAKESPHCKDSNKGVIVIYTTKSAVNYVGFKVSKLTRVLKIHYKTNAATMARIYEGDPDCIIKTIHYNNGIPKLVIRSKKA